MREQRPDGPDALPDRRMGADRGRVRHDDLGVTETLFAVGNGYLGHARQRRGGSGDPRARHLHQRLPRDLADPARRGGVRVRPRRPDHRQRPRQQDDQALRRRRADAARGRRPRGLRADTGLPGRRAAPGDHLAHAGRQAGPGVVDPDGVLHPAAPGDHDLRGHHARRRRAGGDLLADPQPAGRPGRVPRPGRRDGRRRRPAQGGGLRGPGARAAEPLVARTSGSSWATAAPTPR